MTYSISTGLERLRHTCGHFYYLCKPVGDSTFVSKNHPDIFDGLYDVNR